MSFLMVISPAKSLDYETPPVVKVHTEPEFVKQAQGLVKLLKPMTPAELGSLMDISDKLATLNAARFAAWKPRFDESNSKQAVLAFNGDVYDGLDATSLSAKDLDFAQKHLRILSGLYGVLKPLDLMQPYRLEMGTALPNPKGKDLYAYWKGIVAPRLNEELQGDAPVLLNLASEEYFKSVDLRQLNARVVNVVFEDCKNGKYKVISFFAKKARGLMARYVIQKRITRVEKIKAFDLEGYAFVPEASKENTWVFRRNLESV